MSQIADRTPLEVFPQRDNALALPHVDKQLKQANKDLFIALVSKFIYTIWLLLYPVIGALPVPTSSPRLNLISKVLVKFL